MKPNVPLSDADLCRYLDEGYLLLDTSSIPESTHDQLFEAAGKLHQRRAELSDPLASLDAIADKLHSQVPLLSELLAHPVVDGALATVLGSQYFRYDHSFIHQSGPFDQSYHKDSPLPWSTPGGMRSHRPNWAMIFYYPQAVSLDMGPTEILPGTQYWNVNRPGARRKNAKEGEDRFDNDSQVEELNQLSDEARERQFAMQRARFDRSLEAKKLTVPKGSLVLVHFDLFHRGTRSHSTSPRYLYKFWYTRTVEPPVDPSARRSFSYQALDSRRQPLIEKHAKWLGLEVTARDEEFEWDGVAQEADWVAATHLQEDEEIEDLIEVACSGDEAKRRSAIYALVGHDEVSRIVSERLRNSTEYPERNCAGFLLGELTNPRLEDLETLVKVVKSDGARDVRLTANNALGRSLRRRMSLGQAEVPTDLVEAWERSLSRAKEHTMRAGIVQSAERQCIYTAMLNFVSGGLTANLQPPQFVEISQLLSDRLSTETDRYAYATGQEVLSRLEQYNKSNASMAHSHNSNQARPTMATSNA